MSARPLMFAFAAVVVSFVLSTTIAEYSDLRIREAAEDVVKNASPTMVRLADVRTVLRHLEVAVDDFAERPPEGGPPPPDEKEVRRLQSELRNEWQGYQVLPTFPGEKDLWHPVELDLAALDRHVDAVVGMVAAGDRLSAERALEEQLKPSCDRLDGALGAIVELNRRAELRLARRIDDFGQRSVIAAILLDGASVALTVLMALLLLRAFRRYEATIARRADELEQFAGRVAHDILSPLSAVGMSLNIVERGPSLEPRTREFVARGLASLRRVQTIVEGLLGFARAGAQPEPGSRADAAQVIQGVVAELAPLVDQASATLQVERLEERQVAASPGVLTSLISNLLRNAIKYIGSGPERRIQLRAFASDDRLRVEVEDTGPGLPGGLERRVFEPYVRGHDTGQPGIGLGLATVKRISEAHGGAVGVRSRPGQGSLFWFELPLAAPDGKAARSEPAAAPPPL
jgi:signal transduction histidine kinase